MTASNRIGEATIVRAMDKNRNIMATQGSFGALFRGYQDHSRRWETDLDGLTFTMMRQGLAAAALHLTCRPIDETMGFTLNFQKPPLNLFLGADAGQRSVTGRVFTENVQTDSFNRLFVQTYRVKSGVSQSSIDFDGLDILDAFETYYTRSVQNPARFFELDEDRFVMALALPDFDSPWLQGLDRPGIEEWLAGSLTPVDEGSVRLYCGCSREKMLGAIRGMFADRPEEVFGDDDEAEVTCPRCGTHWQIDRSDLGKAP